VKKSYYITTTAPYVNAEPHIGFALEIVQADVLARYHSELGSDVFFNTGTDEHGKKIYEAARTSNKEVWEYVDYYAEKFDLLKSSLNLSYNSFQRTTSVTHIEAAQEMWRRVERAGYIEKGIYRAKYCVGCEMEKQDSELAEGVCPLHPSKPIEFIEEENYFFKFSRLGSELIKHYERYPDFVIPTNRQKEIKNFVEGGLVDFSISRLKEKMPWGIPVPGDEAHVMYVWFDALTYYISALGWPKDEDRFVQYWGDKNYPRAVQVAGKDNLRQQGAMWQAMLIAAGLPPTRQILIHGFITSEGRKMSKSLGNVVNPLEYVERYGTDALRYYLLAKMSPFEDSDFTREKFEEVYRSDLQNGLGNLVARVEAMSEKLGLRFDPRERSEQSDLKSSVYGLLDEYRFDLAMERIWSAAATLDRYISSREVWKMESEERTRSLRELVLGNNSVESLLDIAELLKILLPDLGEEIWGRLTAKAVVKGNPLFPPLG